MSLYHHRPPPPTPQPPENGSLAAAAPAAGAVVPEHLFFAPFYTTCTILGILSCFYLIIKRVQRDINMPGVALMAVAFCNLLGFAISPTLIAASIFFQFPLESSINALKLGDLGFIMGFVLFCLAFSCTLFPGKRREFLLMNALYILVNIADLVILLLLPHRPVYVMASHLATLTSSIGFLIVNIALALTATSRLLRHRKYRLLPERAVFERQCGLLCFLLVTFSTLPKITYDAFDSLGSPAPRHEEYFDLNTFLFTRTLLYVSALVQALTAHRIL